MANSFLKQYLLVVIFIMTTSFSGLSGSISLDRVEPQFWWVGMNNPQLQILVYGSNISDAKVELSYPGVSLERVVHVENSNYLFLNLILDHDVKPGSFDIRFNRGEKVVASYNYELKSRNKNSSLRKGFDNSDVIYLIMPDRFANGNAENDFVDGMQEKVGRNNPNGRHGGDIQGIINKLDYLQDLGITAIWSTPLMEDNQPVVSYHQYAISDYYKIDPRFGSNQDYERLSRECRKRGIKLIMDMVTNHCGTEHYWIKDLPMQSWVHQWDGYTNSNHRKTTITDPYVSEIDLKTYQDGWFDHSMADLNQKNDLLMTYFIQNNIWWIEYADLGGIRLDTYFYNDKEAMARWGKAILNEYPDFNMVGEAWMSVTSDVAYWQKDAFNADGYNSYLPCVMDFPLMDAIGLAFNEKQGWNNGLVRLYETLSHDYLYADANNIMIFADNHDTSRILDVLNYDANSCKLAMTFLLTTRGIPQIYSGCEILMRGAKSEGDGVMRRDFPGGWNDDQRNAFQKEGRTAQENDFFNYLKTLLNYRKSNPVLHNGKLIHFVPENDTYVYFRSDNDKTVMVVLNNNESDSRRLDCERFSQVMDGFSSAKNIISGQILYDIEHIDVPGKSALILELR